MGVIENTKSEIKGCGVFLRWGIMFVVVMGILGFLGNYIGFFNYAFFAPKQEQVRYNVFKESQAYNDGMIRDLEDLKMTYQQADANGKTALKGTILHRFSIYDKNRLPADLQSFYNVLENEGNQ